MALLELSKPTVFRKGYYLAVKRRDLFFLFFGKPQSAEMTEWSDLHVLFCCLIKAHFSQAKKDVMFNSLFQTEVISIHWLGE